MKKIVVITVLVVPVQILFGLHVFTGNQSNTLLQASISQNNSFDGSLVQSFGDSSFVRGSSYTKSSITGSSASYSDSIQAIALQPDGKIIAVGPVSSLDQVNFYWGIARYSSNGQLDPTFVGGNGTTSVIPGTIFIGKSISGSPEGTITDIPSAVVVTSDGSILVGGHSAQEASSYFAVARLSSDGSLDSAFVGGNGTNSLIPGTLYIGTSIGGYSTPGDQLNAMALQADGKLVTGGITSDETNLPWTFALARFNENGSLDTSFSGGNGALSQLPGTIYLSGSISGQVPDSCFDVLNNASST